jgi:hypothetical protein
MHCPWPQREEANQRPLCIPTISQPIHAKAEHPYFNATSKIHFNCRVQIQRMIGWLDTAQRPDADP